MDPVPQEESMSGIATPPTIVANTVKSDTRTMEDDEDGDILFGGETPDAMKVDPSEIALPTHGSLSLPVQVENISRSRLHLYHSSVHIEFSVCRLWKCGEPSKPRDAASFYSSFDTIPLCPSSFGLTYQLCSNCFGSRLLHRYGWSTSIPTKDELMRTPVADPVEEGSDTLDESSSAGSESSDSE